MFAGARLFTLFKRVRRNNLAALEMQGAAETYCTNTAAQAELRFAFCRRKHAVIARAFGISPAQSR